MPKNRDYEIAMTDPVFDQLRSQREDPIIEEAKINQMKIVPIPITNETFAIADYMNKLNSSFMSSMLTNAFATLGMRKNELQ